MRRPTIARQLGLVSGRGVSDVLIGSVSLAEATHRIACGANDREARRALLRCSRVRCHAARESRRVDREPGDGESLGAGQGAHRHACFAEWRRGSRGAAGAFAGRLKRGSDAGPDAPRHWARAVQGGCADATQNTGPLVAFPPHRVGTCVRMNQVKGGSRVTGDLADALLSVGEVKLGIQVAVSVGYDTQALGCPRGQHRHRRAGCKRRRA